MYVNDSNTSARLPLLSLFSLSPRIHRHRKRGQICANKHKHKNKLRDQKPIERK